MATNVSTRPGSYILRGLMSRWSFLHHNRFTYHSFVRFYHISAGRIQIRCLGWRTSGGQLGYSSVRVQLCWRIIPPALTRQRRFPIWVTSNRSVSPTIIVISKDPPVPASTWNLFYGLSSYPYQNTFHPSFTK